MVKAYLRYAHEGQFGVVSSSICSICCSQDGELIFTGALEDVLCWKWRQGTLCRTLRQDQSDEVSGVSEATCLEHSGAAALLVAGYSDGRVRLYQVPSSTADLPEEGASAPCCLTGHTRAVSALAFSSDGSLLASGSQDTEIVVWDVVGETGLFQLCSHTGQITALAFLNSHNMLLSASKDGTLRVWDLATQHCVQQVLNIDGEIWALAVDPAEQMVLYGSAGADLHAFQVRRIGDNLLPTTDILVPFGVLPRRGSQRVSGISIMHDGQMLAVTVPGKHLQVWRRRSAHDAARKAKRRKKRKEEKKGVSAEEVVAKEDAEVVTVLDHWVPFAEYRPHSGLRSVCFLPSPQKAAQALLVVSFADNRVGVLSIDQSGVVAMHRELGSASNRSGVRGLALSDTDQLLLSCGSGGTRLWNPLTGVCLNSVPTGYGLSAVFAPGARFAMVGCKDGKIDIIDIGLAAVVERVDAHQGQVWTIDILPDRSGMVSGSADKRLKVWQWAKVTGDGGVAPFLGLELQKTVNCEQDVLCVRVSQDGKLVAVSLISNVIKVFYLDTMKWALDLYGHKLPALALDISSDGALLASGSADKNLKIWGLDFGDCHKSLFAHDDSVMGVAFVRDTHYVFTVGKDRMLKYWDADKFELLLELSGHHAEVWCLKVSRLGDFVITGSHDRSLRRWQRSTEPFFLEEEKEKRMEQAFETNVNPAARRAVIVPGAGVEQVAVASAAQANKDALTAADQVMEALELAGHEEEAQQEAGYQPNVLLRGQEPGQYVLQVVRAVRSHDLEAALTVLSFPDALKLLNYVSRWLEDASAAEVTVRATVIMLNAHQARLMATPACRPLLATLSRSLHTRIQSSKNRMGFNLAGLRHVQALARARAAVPPVMPTKRVLEAL